MNDIVSITIRGNSKAAVLAAIDKLTHVHPDSIYPVKITESKTGKRVALKCGMIVEPFEEDVAIAAEYDYTEGYATATIEPEDWAKKLDRKESTYMVIEYQGIRSLVAEKPGYPERLYWFGGISYMTRTENVKILHTFPPTDDYLTPNEYEIAFWRDWNPPKKGEVTEHGWLSPTGDFYPCGYGEHESLADQIVAAFYGKLEGSKYLDNYGWLRVQDGNVVWMGNGSPPATQAQIDVLWDISRLEDLDSTHVRWAERYLKEVEVV
jgi:hypothetical protein